MLEMMEANWLLFLLAFLIGVAIAWYIFNVRRRTRVKADRRDVLDEGSQRASRNQALLDAPARPVDAGTDLTATGKSSPAMAGPYTPRSTASLPLPGAVAGIETAVNAAAGIPNVIGKAEQDEAEWFRQHETGTAPSEPADQSDRWRVTPKQVQASEEPAPAPATPPSIMAAPADELTRLKGVGPKLLARLHELGIHRLDQIAGWDDTEIDRIDRQLGRFQGRIRRDEWVTQARLLASGDQQAFQEKFGRLSNPGT